MATAIRNNVSRNEMPPVSDVSPPENPAPITRQGDEVVSRKSLAMSLLSTGYTRAVSKPTVTIDGEAYTFNIPTLVVDSDIAKAAEACKGLEKGYGLKIPPIKIDGDVETPRSARYEGQSAADKLVGLFALRDSKQQSSVSA